MEKTASSDESAAAFLSRLSSTVETYLTQKCGFSAAGKTRDQLRDELSHRCSDPSAVNDTVSLLTELDRHRFGAQHCDRAGCTNYVESARRILKTLDGSFSRRGSHG